MDFKIDARLGNTTDGIETFKPFIDIAPSGTGNTLPKTAKDDLLSFPFEVYRTG